MNHHMNIIATLSPPSACVAMKSPARSIPPAPAGDNYNSLLVQFMKIGDQLKIQSIAIEHARECAAKSDWPGVQLGLAILCCAAQDIRKIAAAANEKIDVDIDDCVNVYSEQE